MTALATPRRGAARYRVVLDPLADRLRPFKITDEWVPGAFCALPDRTGHLKELAFRNAKAAREWLAAMKGAE